MTFLGRIDYQTPYYTYDGGLLKKDNALYYINAKQIMTVKHFAKFKNLQNIIRVVE